MLVTAVVTVAAIWGLSLRVLAREYAEAPLMPDSYDPYQPRRPGEEAGARAPAKGESDRRTRTAPA